MKTIENCRLIKRAVKAGIGNPNIRGGKCEGYCTEHDDEPLEECKRCRNLEGANEHVP